ncbi:isomerase [Lentzea guizhouensis]|uniref:2-hydroxychromene-2-carboxylate isomerase n=1 Tax=Lentzea guizhouensis TaxID=1586287 RepID=A0A1B2HPW6_9PSEU|nr:DsbA family protein [Lentzea guizhouensis]ANZ39752.1 isomerase [Lentzea guizhouensis]
MKKDRLRYYFSFRSPYSWLAHRELLRSHGDVAAATTWIPFWEPDEQTTRMLGEAGGQVVYAVMSREKHFYVLQDVRRLAAARGLTFRWPHDPDPCWEVPHLAYLVAESCELGAEFAEGVHRARWEEGRDICDRGVIADIASGLGLDPTRTANAADDLAVRERGVAALLAAHDDRVFGVPFFVRGFDHFWGLDRLATFADTVRAAPPSKPGDETPAPPAVVTDGGHAGGCG